MKLAWLVQEFMECVQKPEKILMGPQAYGAYIDMVLRNQKTHEEEVLHRFMGVPLIQDPTIITNHVIFIAKTLTWTPD